MDTNQPQNIPTSVVPVQPPAPVPTVQSLQRTITILNDCCSSRSSSSGGSNQLDDILCFGCSQVLEQNHLGIRCAQGHHLCSDCSRTVISISLAEPKINLPPKCMTCKIALNPSVFERQLTPEEYDKYTNAMLSLLWFKDCLKENEILAHCGFCSYLEIRYKAPGAQFMFCQHKDCKKVSCLVCCLELPKMMDNYDEAQDEEYEKNMGQIEKHFKCAELEQSKKIFEEAFEHGQKVPCPGCGLAGMKDDACTHMRCPDCQTSWCYLCGLAESNCDKDTDNTGLYSTAPSIYQHNNDWENNPKRCPMYFTSIQDIDRNWPDNEYDCLERFHKIRILRYLRQAYDQLGSDVIEQLDKQFGCISTCGFTLDEIKHGNEQLIDYNNHD